MPTIVPFVPGVPEQKLDITLDKEPYVLRARWNSMDVAWYLDAWERDGKTPIAFSLKLVLGVKIGNTYNHPLFVSGLFLIDLSNTGIEPQLGDLGTRVILVHLTAEDAVLLSQPVP